MFYLFYKMRKSKFSSWGKVTYSRCPIYSMTTPRIEFRADCNQGVAPSTMPQDKGTEGNVHWRNGSWWNELKFRANIILSRFPPDTSPQTTLPRQQSFSQWVPLHRLISLSTMPFQQRSPTLSLLPLNSAPSPRPHLGSPIPLSSSQ